MTREYKYEAMLSGCLILAGLYLTSLFNYLLFHSLAETFSIIVACGIFIVAWNVRRTLDNSYLLVLGVAYLYIAGLDLVHTLSYKGMGVFPKAGTNLPTQMWIAARYLESLSLLFAPILMRKSLRAALVFAVYGLIFSLMLLSIFSWSIFPDCFIEGSGLTAFKKISEYIICIFLAGSMILLYRRRGDFDENVLKLLVVSILLTIGSELFFTLYVHAYGLSNLVGHFLKILSFFLIYKALIETGLLKPYNLLFRNLKQSERTLRKNEMKYRGLVESLREGIWVLDKKGKTAFINPRMAQMLGYEPEELLGQPLSFFMDNEGLDLCRQNLKRRRKGEKEVHDFDLIRKNGELVHALIETSPEKDDAGRYTGSIAAVTDITERKRAEEGLKWELSVNEALSQLYAPLMSSSSSIEDVSDIILRHAKALTGSEHGYVSSTDPKTGELVTHSLSRMVKNRCRVGELNKRRLFRKGKDGKHNGLWGHALNTGAAFVANSPASHPASGGTPEGHVPIRRFLSVPIMLGKDLVGQIALANKDEDYTERDLQAVQRLATHYALAVQRWRGNEALKEAYDTLEMRVRERTLNLAEANEKLRKQIKERKRAEEALRESEKKYSTLVEASLTGVFIQQDERSVFSNVRFARMHGYTREEITGMDSLDLIHPDDRPAVKEYREMRMKGEYAPSEYEARELTKEGEVIWVTRRNTRIAYRSKPAILGNVVDITKRKEIEMALRKSEQELRLLSSQLISAQEKERKRIAQELHDSIGQSLGAIKFSLENVLNQMSGDGPRPGAKLLRNVIPLTQKAIEEVRRIVMDLRPSTLDDLGILPTISWFCRRFQDIYSGIRIDSAIELEERDIPEDLKTVVYRVLQEGLNNIAKHSGASRVHLSFKRRNDRVELIIEDNGVGFDFGKAIFAENSEKGFGLASMKERTELSGGDFYMTSTKGKGTRIRAAWAVAEQRWFADQGPTQK